MRTVTVGKQFTFHAAHQLPHHNGQCRDLHGHTYKLEVAVTGKVSDPDGASDEGMVIDFADIKAVYKEYIEPLVEHKFLNDTLFNHVPTTLIEDNEGDPPVAGAVLPCALTTCENIARWIHEVVTAQLVIDETVRESYIRITLWETPTSYARVPADRNGVDNR